jgi:peptidoglycan/xylan/chitin deacetylase (PgdA/CDA1 family)
MKTFARRLLKIPPLIGGIAAAQSPGYCFLIYHGVSDQLPLELDLPYDLFRRQIEFIARTYPVVAYDEALAGLAAGYTPARTTFVLTFDDGYEDFYTHVFPLLVEWQLPAIVYVTTGFVEDGIPYPVRRHGANHMRPATWAMLAEMAASGLVTIGAHTHTHPNLVEMDERQLTEELERPLDLFRQRLGLDVPHFAYPKAAWDQRTEAAVRCFYRSAVVSGGQRAHPNRFDAYRIPRLPIRRSDGWLFFQAKLAGRLDGEEALYTRLRQMVHPSA